MLFSSPLFLFLFLPLVLLLYYLVWENLRNYLLLISSLVFFAWGGVSYTTLLIISISFNYLLGLGIGKNPGSTASKRYLAVGVVLNVIFLGFFKYADFVVDNLNLLHTVLSFKIIKDPGIVLPIGISFYTFHSLSYLIDIYRKDAETQRNPFNLGLYIAFFPQLIAGPILRYHDIAPQLKSRTINLQKFAYGIRRFIIGLGKKVILANSMEAVADAVFNSPHNQLNGWVAWLGLVAYALQIYFDFSGYSDMAIGLGKMFGFTFMENFNYPYVSRSIKEFWRRWHISLSTWFRDYLYVPLGGNRVGKYRTYFNLLLVFFITGLWHGASWTFVLWGFLHGTFLIIERLGNNKFPGKMWKPLQHFYTIFVVLMAWVLFRTESLSYAGSFYGALFGITSAPPDVMLLSKFINTEFYILFAISLLSASGIFVKINSLILGRINTSKKLTAAIAESYMVLQAVFLIGVFFICSVYLITNTYNPFIYYRF
ncbi:MAG: MBOAT family protein [Bacteroidota bacterium]